MVVEPAASVIVTQVSAICTKMVDVIAMKMGHAAVVTTTAAVMTTAAAVTTAAMGRKRTGSKRCTCKYGDGK